MLFQRNARENNTSKDYRDFFSHCHVPNVRIKDFNALIDEKISFDLPVKNAEKAYQKIIEMSNNNDYTTGNLLDFGYFKEKYKLIANHLNKKTKLEGPQQTTFIGKIEKDDESKIFSISEKSEETI